MVIYVIRHGETRANEEGRMQGWTDDPLNQNGISLAEITGREMKGIHFDYCISSPLKRAWKTAEIILKESGNENVEILFDDRIREISMGDWERKKIRPGENEIDEEELQVFFSNAFLFPGCPEGETTQQVCERTQAFLKEIINRDDGKIYLIATHGFAVRAMLNFLYSDPVDFWHGHVPYNCSVNIIEAENGNARLIEDDKVYYDKENCIDRYR